MVYIYQTDFGRVRVSEREESLLRLADEVRRWPSLQVSARAKSLLAKAEAIRAACERFAIARLDGPHIYNPTDGSLSKIEEI